MRIEQYEVGLLYNCEGLEGKAHSLDMDLTSVTTTSVASGEEFILEQRWLLSNGKSSASPQR